MKPDFSPLSTNFGIVRQVRPSDMAQLVEMVSRLATHHGDVSSLTIDDLKRDLFNDRPWISVLVAERNGQLVGYAAMYTLFQLHFGSRGIEIHHLYIEEPFRGRGVGRCLIKACRIAATNQLCRYLKVGTHPDNQKAQAFYASCGFEPIDAHPPRFTMSLA